MLQSTFFAFLFCLLVYPFAAAEDLRLQLNTASLSDGERTFPLVSSEENWAPVHTIGNQKLCVEAHRVVDITDPAMPREVMIDQKSKLRWVGQTGGIAYLASEKFSDCGNQAYDRTFLRLDLSTMQWLQPLEPPEPAFAGNSFGASGEILHDVRAEDMLVTPQSIAVLYQEPMPPSDTAFLTGKVSGYQVCYYLPGEKQPTWIRPLPAGKYQSRLRASPMVSQRASFNPLSYVNETLIVCPSPYESITAIMTSNGKVAWKLPAIWEYDRAFIGPSTFLHYIERFGLDDAGAINYPILDSGPKTEIDAKQLRRSIKSKVNWEVALKKARAAFNKRYVCSITAGPFVTMSDNGRDPRIYVAACRSPKPIPGAVGQPAHALLYELEPYGEGAAITSMARLPRVVVGGPWRAMPDGLVVSCEMGALARLKTYETTFNGMMGPGNLDDDCVLPVDWYREYSIPYPQGIWGAAGSNPDVAAFAEDKLFRPGIAYLKDKGAKTEQLVINVVDLTTGLNRDLTLQLPFEGSLAKDELITIDHLALDGNQLTVVFELPGKRSAVTFDLSKLLAK